MHVVLKRFLLVAFALAIAVPLVACSDQTEDANKAIDRSNAQVEKYNKVDGELADLMDQVNAVEPTPDSAKKAIEMIDKAINLLAEQKKSTDTAITELESIEKMDVSEEFKTYAKMQLVIAKKRNEIDAVAGQLVQDIRKLYEAVANGAGEAEITKLGESIEAKASEADALEQEIEKLEKEADEYFDKNQLGG